jgi:integrase
MVSDGRHVVRRVGPLGARGNDGLTRTPAEAVRGHAITAAGAKTRGGSSAFEEAAARYLASRETIGVKRGTLEDYESHLLPNFGSMLLDEITPDHIDAFIASKRAEGKAPKSVLNYLGLLNAIFGHSLKRDWCTHNPVAAVDKPRNRRNLEIRYLNHDELERLLDAAPPTPLGRLERTLYLAAAMTGLRRGELLALRWQDVDWTAGVLRVRRTYTRGQFGTPKTQRSNRAVPLADRVLRELFAHRDRAAHRDDLDLVFAHPLTGRVLDPSRVRLRFQSAAKRAGLRQVRFHDLRHTFGTRMAAAGAPLRAIQEWLGHTDYRTTSIYADYAPDASGGAAWAARAFATDEDLATAPPPIGAERWLPAAGPGELR